MNNPIQHALHSEVTEMRKLEDNAKKNGLMTEERMTTQRSQTENRVGGTQRSGAERSQATESVQLGQFNFRNNIERFHHLFDEERVENINDTVTFDRVQKYNAKYDPIIERSKLSIKLYNLLGYSQTQYILFK